MTDERVRRIADAVLYEGYVLWPYRPSALKNQRRWTFGGVYPRGWSERAPDDPWRQQAQCLLEGDGTGLDVRVRFLHVVERGLLDARGEPVPGLEVEGTRYLAWEEATEREVAVAGPGTTAVDVPGGSEAEPLSGGAGTIVRSWEPLRGRVEVGVEPLGDGLGRVTVAVENETPWDGAERERALRRTFCSTHAVLHAPRGGFVSLTDPPERLRDAARACENVGTWPVLVGEEGERHTLLASPIILPDYPRIAPESPGDLFDGGEIDELLILNVLALTEEEREEVRASDPRVRALLDRCEGLPPEQLMRLHGTFRDPRSLAGR